MNSLSGVEFRLSINPSNAERNLRRSVVKTDTASISVPELELEVFV